MRAAAFDDRRSAHAKLGWAAASALALSVALPAQAWVLSVTPAPRSVFLHVGNGVLYGNLATINLVEANVPAAQLGNGTAVTMTTTSTQVNSLLDNWPTCAGVPNSVLIGAAYRRNNSADGPASATLRVASPANLVSAAGDTIPISQVSWTVSAPGSGNPNVIPAGTFSGSTQTLTTVNANTYIENCHVFSYANSALRAAGTYNAQVSYTLSSP
ncbi:MAG: hypothetical protein NZ533_02655 [Casimicrobiaceae bacterium]|nr:hypothetical protein [Casimicrobiaceae bacterium]MCX8099585.1 hypothetical protein [Casimicrobiaceae bacterium]MDW8312705.1 hypothetical protein [Burkholderiales bacterium]